ncbi:Arc family DNA-binding protein [Rheinheimera sp. 4Y26]|uniref:Arc family DNA-binding protein n=1 Tax=Rheinheimera sp. 4Y26 TaxID=2977811 RepID=UPI0021B131B8|nr:Arc family DNA-binding protein [Rheinheimera sp. 4Y26]MCT6698592.1 Arc family DNA-binding protein [Rheinheimera sp. 4Y26]
MAKKAFALRIDEQVLAQLQSWADAEFRSVNGQIEYLLHQALLHSGRLKATASPQGEQSDLPGATEPKSDT